MKKKVFIFLFNGFSDWEISYLTPEINKSEKFEIVYFSKDGNPVVSMGGLKITPDISFAEVDVNDIACIVTSTAFKSVDEAVEVYYDSYWNTVPKVQIAYLLRGIWHIIAQPRLYSPVIHRGHIISHGHWLDTIGGVLIKRFDK